MRPILSGLVALLVLVGGSPIAAQDLGARLDSAMRAAEARGFSGVVRVERNGVTLLKGGYGLADRGARIPFTPASVVQIGSNTKDFTAVAVLQLQRQGRLSLGDPLMKYFPAAPADKRDITMAQLLDHRAGFPLGLGGDFEPVTRAALVDSAMRVTLLFAPGTRASYSNTGYSLLAAIIEQITGRTYDEHVRDAILAPLGLRRTGFLLPGFAAADLAHGYLGSGTDAGTMLARPHAPDGPWWNLRGNGGMLSTVDDMHAFYSALFDGGALLSRADRGARFDPDEPIGLAGSDGVNFFLYDRDPQSGTEIIIASTNAAVRAPMIRRALGPLLGLPDPEQGGGELARRAGGRPAPEAMARVLAGLVHMLNTRDTANARRFITEHFVIEPGTPSVEERVQRMVGMRERLGALTIIGVETFDDGPAEVRLRSAQEDGVLLRVAIERVAPYRIRGLQVQLGGPN